MCVESRTMKGSVLQMNLQDESLKLTINSIVILVFYFKLNIEELEVGRWELGVGN